MSSVPMLTMISAAPMMKYWGTSQNTLMGTASMLFSKPRRCTCPSRTASTMAAATIENVEICAGRQRREPSRRELLLLSSVFAAQAPALVLLRAASLQV